MKLAVVLIGIFSLTILSCVSDKTGEKSESSESENLPSGKYYRVSDNDRAGVEGIMDLVSEIEFKKNYCHFTYVTTRMSGKYEVDEGYVYINTGGELGTLSLEIIDGDYLEGEGYIHGTFKREKSTSKKENRTKETSSDIEPYKTENPEEIHTSTENPNSARYPDHRNSNVETNVTNSTQPSNGGTNVDNPFAGGFGGGEGGGSTAGPGSGGDGISDSGRRVLKHVSTSGIQIDYDAKLYYKVSINADGYVVDVQAIKSKTTTTDQVITRKVADLIKKQVRYSKSPGAPIQTLSYVVNLKVR